MSSFVALLRGINVGTAKAVPMAELRQVMESLGYGDVSTVLKSGNVVFSRARTGSADSVSDAPADVAAMAVGIEAAVLAKTGVGASVLVFDAATFTAIAREDPLGVTATDGSRTIVTFLTGPVPSGLWVPDADILAPEVLRVGSRAVYQWLPDGVMQTKVDRSFWKQFGTPVTARNRNTVEKLVTLLG